MKKNRPKRIFLCSCFLGDRWLKVYAVTGCGNAGTGKTQVEDKNYGEITIGIDRSWGDTLGTLWHEFFEMECLMVGHQYEKIYAWSHTTHQRLFTFNHDQYTEMCCRCGDAIQVCLNELGDAWTKWGLEAPIKKKRRKKK